LAQGAIIPSPDTGEGEWRSIRSATCLGFAGGLVEHVEGLVDFRGKGLMLGLKCVGPNTEMVERLRRCGLLTVGAGDNVVRLLPPLIISDSEIDQALDMLDRAAREAAS